jgi:hypothetical protein
MSNLVGAVGGNGCTVVVKAYLVSGPTANDLTVALHAIPKDFAAKHHGHVIGNCD